MLFFSLVVDTYNVIPIEYRKKEAFFMKGFNDIPEKVKVPSPNLIGREVYIMPNSNCLSINDLVMVEIDEIVSTTRDEMGIVVKGTQRYINRALKEEKRKFTGHAVYPLVGVNKVETANGIKYVIANCDDFGPYLELKTQKEMKGKFFANAVFRYRGIFMFFKITGNYLFDTEDELIDMIETLNALKADLTPDGIIIQLFGEKLLIKEYDISINKEIFRKQRHKQMAYEAICQNENVEYGEAIPLRFRRYVIKYL